MFFPLQNKSSLQRKASLTIQGAVLLAEPQENNETAMLQDSVREHLEKCLQPPVLHVEAQLKFHSNLVATNRSTVWTVTQKREADINE